MKSSETEHIVRKLQPYSEIFLTFLGFGFLTLVTTYPLFWHMGSGTYGFPGDSLSTIWSYWRNYENFLNNNFPSFFCNLVGAPFGVKELKGMLDPHFYEGLLLTMLTNEVIAYNLMVMLGIFASGFMAYLLSRSLWRNQWGAIVSGVAFGFSPMLAMSATGHMGFTHLQWLPLYLLSLFYFKQKRNLLSAILCGIALAIVVVTNFYIGYISIVATVVFVGCWVRDSVRRNVACVKWKPVGLFLLVVLLGIVISLPWTGPILRTILFKNVSDSPLSQIANRPYRDLFSNSARPWDYILPPVDHPVLGGITERIYSSLKNLDLGVKGMPGLEDNWTTRYGNWWGQVYVGWTLLALAMYGFITAFRWRKGLVKHSERFAIIFFGILFAVSVWFAMPPEIPIGELLRNLWGGFPDWRLPTPSYLLYKILPMFRRYTVFGIATILSVAVLAGVGMREFLLRRQSRWGKGLAVILIFGLIFFEFIHEPRHTRFPAVPQEYEWLAGQPGDIIIAEYPIYYRHSLFYQRVHSKRMVNWNVGWTLVDKSIWPKIEDLTKSATAERLGAMGVQYVLLHTTDYFGHNPVDSLQFMGYTKPLRGPVNGLELIKETPTGQIFKVTDKSAIMMVYPDPNKEVKKPWLSDTIWKWQTNTQRLYIFNTEHKPIKITLSAKSPRSDGRFRLFCEKEKCEGVRQLQWNNGRVFISDVECAADSETIIEVYFPNKIGGKETVWSELSVDVVPKSDLVANGTFASARD